MCGWYGFCGGIPYDLLSYGIKSDQETARRKQRQTKNAEEREQGLAQVLERVASDIHDQRIGYVFGHLMHAEKTAF